MANEDEGIYQEVIAYTSNYCDTVPSTSSTSTTSQVPKKRFGFKNFKVTRFSSNQLLYPITMDLRADHQLVLRFNTDDKLVVMFRYKGKYAVYRKSDSAVVILLNPKFKKPNSTIMFDGDKMGAILHNVSMVIMYAVAKTNFNENDNGISFNTFDLILVLAKCRGVYLGITAENKVGFFPPDKVVFITRPRSCLFPGMTLKVEASITLEARSPTFLSVHRNDVHTITKGQSNLFDWHTPFQLLKVPLHVFRECESSTTTSAPPPLPAARRLSRTDSMPTSAPPPPPLPAARRQSGTESPTRESPPVPAPRCLSPKNETAASEHFFPQTPTEASDSSDTIVDNDERLYHTYEQSEDLAKGKFKHRESLLQKLQPYQKDKGGKFVLLDNSDHDRKILTQLSNPLHYSQIDEDPTQDILTVVANWASKWVLIHDDLRKIVSECFDDDDDDALQDFCERLKVSKNKIKAIDAVENKAYELLGIWCLKFGTEANVGILIDALAAFNPEDLNIILEDMHRYLEDARVSQHHEDGYSFIGPLPKVALQREQEKRVKAILELLRNFYSDVECNDEIRNVVSMYFHKETTWLELSDNLKLPRMISRQIEKNKAKNDIEGKTFDLLGQWHQRFGSGATLGVLVDAIEALNPEDFLFILEGLLQTLDMTFQGDDNSGYEVVP